MEVTLRITVLNPPAGVLFRVQRGKKDLFPPAREGRAAISFDFPVRAVTTSKPPRILGPFPQGPPASRFVYVNSGQYAGQAETFWSRRAKVPLAGLTQSIINRASAEPGSVIEAQIVGTGRDGGPCCGTVPLASAWRVVAA